MALRAAQARRIMAATMFGGGGLTLLAASTVALLFLQAKIAARTIGVTPWQRPRVDGVYGVGGGEPLTLLMMGDSTAAGFAVSDPRQTPPVQLASGLSAVADRPVRLRDVSKVGATSQGLLAQLDRVRGERVDLAVIFIGANDVIDRIRPADAVSHLRVVVRELVASGAAVVVATCPDLGTVQPIPQPLRAIARRASQQMAAAQTVAVVEEGGSTVALGDLLSDEFSLYRGDVRSGPVPSFGTRLRAGGGRGTPCTVLGLGAAAGAGGIGAGCRGGAPGGPGCGGSRGGGRKRSAAGRAGGAQARFARPVGAAAAPGHGPRSRHPQTRNRFQFG